MKRIAFIIFPVLLCSIQAMAQQYAYMPFDKTIATDFTYGDYDRNELQMPKYDKDPDAHALVLKEFGKAWITSNGNNTTLTFEYHVKIKIFDNGAFNKGHIEIPLYAKNNGSYEQVRLTSIQGVTHYIQDNGMTHEDMLNPDSITVIKSDKHNSKVIFNMPALHKGCLIEYKYRFESPFLEKFKTWEFQSDIPKVSSKYEVHIPTVFGYNVSLRGKLKLSKEEVALEKYCFESTNLVADCTVKDYEMNDIPAFKTEAYMPSPKNYISALYFQLTQDTKLNNFVNLNQSFQQDVGKQWSDVDKQLKNDDNFGTQLIRSSVFTDKIIPVIAGKTDTLDKAKAIYAYIQKNIRCDNVNTIFSDEGLKKALDKHTGNVADVNLSLVTALNAAGIAAEPVLISTRDNGMVTMAYPAISDFNYVIAAVDINNITYLLDATDPLMQFGMLPSRCLNGQGRVMPVDKPSFWINIYTPQKQSDIYNLDLVLAAGGSLKGTLTHYAKGYSAYQKRTAIKSFKTTADYIKSLSISPGVHITGSHITGADSLDMPVIEVYNVEIDKRDSLDPFILNSLADNPFKPDTRIYPVDMEMPRVSSLTLTLHLPDGYSIDNPPQNISESLPGNGGELMTAFQDNGNTVIYTHQYQFSKSVYPPAEYAALKAFFDKLVLSEKTNLTVKKAGS